MSYWFHLYMLLYTQMFWDALGVVDFFESRKGFSGFQMGCGYCKS